MGLELGLDHFCLSNIAAPAPLQGFLSSHTRHSRESLFPGATNGSSNCSSLATDVITPSLSPAAIAIVAVVIATLSAATVVGNLTVIVAFATDRKLLNVQNVYILNLAVCDLLIGAVVTPFSAADVLCDFHWPLSNTVCKLWLLLDYVLTTESVYTLALISWDRYRLVTLGAAYVTRQTVAGALRRLAVTWAITCALWAPAVLAWEAARGRSVIEADECEGEFIDDVAFTTVTNFMECYAPGALIVYYNVRLYTNIAGRQRAKQQRQQKLQQQLAAATAVPPGGAPVRRLEASPVGRFGKLPRRSAENRLQTITSSSPTKSSRFRLLFARNIKGRNKVRVDAGQCAVTSPMTADLDAVTSPITPDQDAEASSMTPDLDAVMSSKTADHDAVTSPMTPDQDAEASSMTPDLDAVMSSKTADHDAVTSPMTPDQDAEASSMTPDQDAVTSFTTADQRAVTSSMTADQDAVTSFTTADQDAVTLAMTADQDAVTSTMTSDEHAVTSTTTSHHPTVRSSLAADQHAVTSSKTADQQAVTSLMTCAATTPCVPAVDPQLRKDECAARGLFILIAIFVVMWTPYTTYLTVVSLCPSCASVKLYMFTYWLLYYNSLINPLAYAAASPRFRANFRRIWCRFRPRAKT
ncbi:PREDICTED: histamine H1 receptor-like [Priapulus caudatus]|uniref:Histamine H1 receptor-like n=1 Tax=Priapulus caudatus TaxID=37621 RepID=A0ABM1F051_PRICU|nr:PREDICTED: histamine H1 receptor-like [Priapulus caudatus]